MLELSDEGSLSSHHKHWGLYVTNHLILLLKPLLYYTLINMDFKKRLEKQKQIFLIHLKKNEGTRILVAVF